jgi:hypothetical protein
MKGQSRCPIVCPFGPWFSIMRLLTKQHEGAII